VYNIPKYNGGLFDSNTQYGQFLSEYQIADKYIAEAIRKLAYGRDPLTGDEGYIDYTSIDVDHLGSVYEGLLEFHLKIANGPLAVVRENSRDVYVPMDEVRRKKIQIDEQGVPRVVQPGEVFLENDKRERKATGTYYTPDYIVRYIVENTVGPVLEEKLKKTAELFTVTKTLDNTEHPASRELFSLKVLDPAFARQMAACAGLRNRIVHAYDELDPAKVHEAIRGALRDVPVYLSRVNAYLDRAQPGPPE